MSDTTTTIVEISDAARDKILALREGEGIDDLQPFNAEQFVRALLDIRP